MGFQFKIPLATTLAFLNGISVATTYIVSQGDLTTVIIVQAIVNGILAGLSYYKEK
jgi:hypothetical protein